MTNLKMHINQYLKNSLFIILFVVLFWGCEEKNIEDKVIAKVNSSVLTSAELDIALGELKNEKRYRQEYINEWIRLEILFQEAAQNNITKSKEYVDLLNLSRKKLASGMYINKLLEDEVSLSKQELLDYYNSTREDFTIYDKAYVVNRADFKVEENAAVFREIVLKRGWKLANYYLANNENVIKSETNQFLFEHKINPPFLFRIIKSLRPDEVSVILNLEQDVFTIVQLVKNYPANSVPDYEFVEDEVRSRYIAIKNKKIIDEQMELLYSRYNVVINRDN